ncbi:hypothetical protein OCU04_005830 [Sclerotinia nivalis]|uniref:Uncharacterized protein n=1 Tax=Sclerotinia nivalis TaxID=352851 RepID=A0A9X0DKM8_9HELO|nr:hypothetical protein OCU04_005830 [Sclerotinia nivalis]
MLRSRASRVSTMPSSCQLLVAFHAVLILRTTNLTTISHSVDLAAVPSHTPTTNLSRLSISSYIHDAGGGLHKRKYYMTNKVSTSSFHQTHRRIPLYIFAEIIHLATLSTSSHNMALVNKIDI